MILSANTSYKRMWSTPENTKYKIKWIFISSEESEPFYTLVI